MKSQSCRSAVPPSKMAGPMLLAGLTEVPVIGMQTICISTKVRPIARPACIFPAHSSAEENPEGDGRIDMAAGDTIIPCPFNPPKIARNQKYCSNFVKNHQTKNFETHLHISQLLCSGDGKVYPPVRFLERPGKRPSAHLAVRKAAIRVFLPFP